VSFLRWFLGVLGLIWHAPGRTWAGMIAAAPVATWFTAGAGIAWTMVTIAFVWLFRELLTGDQAFWIIVMSQLLTALAIGALAGREITANVGKGGLQLNIGKDDDEPAHLAQVTTTTTVTSPPTPTPAPAPVTPTTPAGAKQESPPWNR
jgi:hypothetical protein